MVRLLFRQSVPRDVAPLAVFRSSRPTAQVASLRSFCGTVGHAGCSSSVAGGPALLAQSSIPRSCGRYRATPRGTGGARLLRRASHVAQADRTSEDQAQESAGACFEVVPLEGRGLGAVATRDIAVGELIFSEKPIIEYKGEAKVWREKLQAEFDRLSAANQELVMSLHDACLLHEHKSVEGIVLSNAFARGQGSFDVALCHTLSRINHSCLPNCEPSWDDDIFRVQVFACAPVRKGEELCYFYTDLRASRAARQEGLQKRYGFLCGCPACSTPQHTESDERRERLLKIEEEFSQIGARDNRTARRGLVLVKESMKLYDQEQLHPRNYRKWACHRALGFNIALGNKRMAQVWAKQALEHSIACHGPSHADTQALKLSIDDLEPGAAERLFLNANLHNFLRLVLLGGVLACFFKTHTVKSLLGLAPKEIRIDQATGLFEDPEGV